MPTCASERGTAICNQVKFSAFNSALKQLLIQRECFLKVVRVSEMRDLKCGFMSDEDAEPLTSKTAECVEPKWIAGKKEIVVSA